MNNARKLCSHLSFTRARLKLRAQGGVLAPLRRQRVGERCDVLRLLCLLRCVHAPFLGQRIRKRADVPGGFSQSSAD